MSEHSPIHPFIEKQGFVLLDGGLATELERRGLVLDSPLWSAHLLASNPAAIGGVHRSYLEAGANCIVSASYQASIPGFLNCGFSRQEAEAFFVESVRIACRARQEYMRDLSADNPIDAPIVAASIGPYGAYLADGSEYRGDYNISRRQLLEFHKPRWEILAATDADLFACETIPSAAEAKVLAQLLRHHPETRAWISFSCRDDAHIRDGTPIEECVDSIADCTNLVALGVNCTEPRYIDSLVRKLAAVSPRLPIVAYPNSGETYDPSTGGWSGVSDAGNFGRSAKNWYKSGARLIGGCCRTGPEHIQSIHTAMLDLKPGVQKHA